MDPKEYKGTMPACFEKGLPRCPAEAVIPTMTVETDEGIKKLSNTVVHVVQNNATYYVDDKHRITEICTEPVERNDYDFDNNPEGFRGQIVFDYATNRAAYFNNAGQSFSLVTDNIDFNALSNRPKYNGVQMTSSTNIPLVPTRVSELANDAHYQTESDVQTTVSNAVATHNTSPTAHNDIRQALADEVSARTAGVKKVADDLADEITARTNADTALEAADTALGNRITAETTNRTNADTALGTRITNETTARQNADSALQSDITAEETARKAADKTLQDNIDAEANTRSLADTTLQSNIAAEATARGNADTALGTRITDEITNRTDADTALGGRIDTEITNRTDADTALGGRIDTEITNRTNADTAIENKLNRTVLYDLEMETDASSVTFVEDKVNLKTGGTSTERDTIPSASLTSAGTISAAEYASIIDSEEKIEALLSGAVAIDNLPANPTQAQLTAAWKTATGKDELINRASIYDSANGLVHTYYTNVSEWEDSPAGGQVVINTFTNSSEGVIKGSTTAGNVSANPDGTGSVSGWTALNNTVAGKQDALTAGSNISISGSTISATDTTYSAGTGLSLTGTTFAVDTTTIAQKSDIPTVNNATLTIQKNGTNVQTFTANSSSNKTANITVPTKTSDLTNDSNFPVDANYVHTDNNFTTTLKNKLDGIAAGAEVNQNAFSTVKVGSTNVAADSKTDTLELVAGSNITLTPDATNDKVTIASTDTNTTYTFANGTNGFTVTPSGGSAQTVTVTPSIANATTSTAGLMSAADKTAFEGLKPVVRKLYSDGTPIPANADLNTPTYLTVGRYGCGSNTTAATLVNCPTRSGFMMDVYNTIDTHTDDQTTASWISRVRKILDYGGREWVQSVEKSGGTITYSSWEKVVYESAMNTELAKKVNVASIDITSQTTTLLALTKALGTAGTNYARWICKTDGGSANISDKPTGATNRSFSCVAYATRYNGTTDYKYRLICYASGHMRPYIAEVDVNATSLSWSQEALSTDINDATLTIQKNGTNVQTFTANSSTNKTANITVPTKVTDLTDAANYVAKDGDFYVTGEGSNFSMTGTSQNVYADLKVKGDTQQTTYSGKNLVSTSTVTTGYSVTTQTISAKDDMTGSFEVQESGSYTGSGLWSAYAITSNIQLEPNTQYTLSMGFSVVSGTAYTGAGNIRAKIGNNYTDPTTNTPLIFTTNSTGVVQLLFYTAYGQTAVSTINTKVKFYNVQLEKGSSASSFEPYTGGVPAPSPDYPQAVEVVTGRQVITSMGKNLYKTPASTTNNGIKYALNPDGTYNIHGTATAQANDIAYMSVKGFTDGATYAFSATKTLKSGQRILLEAYNGSTWLRHVFGSTGTNYLDASHQTIVGAINISGADRLRAVLRIDSGTTVDIDNVGFQLEKASAVTSFEPYLGKEIEVNLGKNLFNEDASLWQQGYYDYSTGEVTANSYRICQVNKTKVTERTTFTITLPTNLACRVHGWLPDGTSRANNPIMNWFDPTENNRSSSFTVPAGWYYGIIIGAKNASFEITPSMLSQFEIQLEKGSTATSYAPYFTPIELCKLGTYQDKIYKSGGKWNLHKEVLKYQLTGSETYTTRTNTSTTHGKYRATNAVLASNIAAVTALSCSHFIANVGANEAAYSENAICGSLQAGYQKMLWFSIANSIAGSLDAFKTWVTNNRPIVYYAIATPTDTEITNPLLVAQLDDLWRNLQSGTNTTNVNVEGDLPAILGVTAFTNTLASAMAGINERMNRLPAIPQITMTTTDPGEGQTLADNHFIAVYNN